MKINLIGQRFGKLIVVADSDNQNSHNHMWHCVCDCGEESDVSTCHLRSGHTKSCGHCQSFTEEEDFIRCTLPSGQSFIFDKEDLDLIRQYSWSIDGHGYVRSWTKKYGYFKLHRMLTGFDNIYLVDHVNGIRTDNRRNNLRIATPHENARNISLRKDNRCGYKGVHIHSCGKYHATIHVNGRTLSLGYYGTPEEAAKAYDSAALLYFGEFAKTNAQMKETV